LAPSFLGVGRGRFSLARISFCPYAIRASRLLTVIACHRPPRAVAIPRAFNASAIARSDVAPAFCISLMIGSTFAACRSALSSMVTAAALRAWASPPGVMSAT
jgi:hypothetical protein